MNGVRFNETAVPRRWFRWGAASIFLWGAFLAAPPLCRADITTGLAGYWKFDDGSGSSAADSSGNGNTGTLQAAPAWVSGKTNQALQFNGADAFVSVNSAASINFTDDFTVAFWTKNTDNKSGASWFNGARFLTKDVNTLGQTDWNVAQNGGKVMCVVGDGNAVSDSTVTATTNTNDNVWHHVACVRTRSTGAMSLYIDGVLNSSAALTTGSVGNAQNLTIGGIGTTTGLNGKMDEVRVYSRALTANDVQQLYFNDQSLPTGCGTGFNVKQDGTQDTTSIAAAVSALPISLSTTSCVVIRDTQTYSEQVNVQGIVSNGYRIQIEADPSFISSAPIISPPANSTAAFQIMNTSVTLQQINIIPANSTSYGVWVSSSNAAISSVSVVDAAGKIAAAGIWLTAANGGSVSNSTASVSAVGADGILLSSASSNSITQSYFFSSGNHGARLDYSNSNTISLSTITGITTASTSLLLVGSSSNTFSSGFVTGTNYRAIGITANSNYNTISKSTMTSISSSSGAFVVDGASWNSVTQCSITNPPSDAAQLLNGASFNTISGSTITTNAINTETLTMSNGASFNTVTNSVIFNPSGRALTIEIGSNFNTVSLSTLTTGGALYSTFVLNASSFNIIDQDYIFNSQGRTVRISNGSYGNTISASTVTAVGSAETVQIDESTANIVTRSLLTNLTNPAVIISTGAILNTISQSVMLNSIVVGPRLVTMEIEGSSNTFSDDTINNASSGGAFGPLALHITASGSNNLVLRSTITTGFSSGGVSLEIQGASNTVVQTYAYHFGGTPIEIGDGAAYNFLSRVTAISDEFRDFDAGLEIGGTGSGANFTTVQDSFIINRSTGHALFVHERSSFTSVIRSTVTSASYIYPAIMLNGNFSTTLSNLYVQGSTAVFMSGSTNTVVSASVLIATNSFGTGVWVSSGNVGVTISNSVLRAGPGGAGFLADGYNSGTINIASGTIDGGQDAIAIATQVAGSHVWITSNTIHPLLGPGANYFGILLNGLATGATVQGNSLLYQIPGTPNVAAWLFARNSAGIVVDHNRFSNPGMINGGTFEGVWFSGTTEAQITFNDIYSTMSAIGDGFLLHLDPPITAIVKENIVFSSMPAAVAGSTETIEVDTGATMIGDYNDFYSGNAINTLVKCAPTCVSYQSLAAWTAATGQDANSIAQDPLYADAANGDFHVKSQTGRLSNGSFVTDPVTSPTIDAADPAAAFALETSPNGGRANMGSYGNTPEASKTFTPLPPSSPAIGAVYLSSVTVTYGTVGAPGYVVDASTASNFTGTLFSSSALNGVQSSLSPQNLTPNTTYFFRVGAIYGGATIYVNTVPASTMTFAASPTPLSFSGIAALQFTVNWSSNSNPNTTPYAVQVSTDINFSIFTATAGTTALSATFASGLTPNATYFVRVQAFNAAGTPTPYALGVVVTVTGIITISANRLPGVWYSGGSAIFFAQGATNYNYRLSTIPLDTPTVSDPLFNGAGVTLPLTSGAQYFHVLGVGGAGNGQVAHFGPIDIDTGSPIVASISAQNSATDPTLIADGGTTLSVTPRFFWPSAVSLSPVVGYSISLTTDPAVIPGSAVNTTITFLDKILTKSGTYYAKVSALNLAGTLGPPASMSFTFTTTPSLNNIVLKSNLINPLRGGCAEIDVQLASAGHFKVQLYNLLGQRVVSLADDDVVPAVYIYNWCGRNSTNELVASGVYLLRIEAPGEKKTLRVGVLK